MSVEAIEQFVKDYYNVVDNQHTRINEFYATNAKLTFFGYESFGNEGIQTFFNNFNRPDRHTIESVEVQPTGQPDVTLALVKATAYYDAANPPQSSYSQTALVRSANGALKFINSIVR